MRYFVPQKWFELSSNWEVMLPRHTKSLISLLLFPLYGNTWIVLCFITSMTNHVCTPAALAKPLAVLCRELHLVIAGGQLLPVCKEGLLCLAAQCGMAIWNAPAPWALLALFTWSIWKGSSWSLLATSLTELAFTLRSLTCSMYGRISGSDASVVFLISNYIFRVVPYVHTCSVRFERFFCASQFPEASDQCSNLRLGIKGN